MELAIHNHSLLTGKCLDLDTAKAQTMSKLDRNSNHTFRSSEMWSPKPPNADSAPIINTPRVGKYDTCIVDGLHDITEVQWAGKGYALVAGK